MNTLVEEDTLIVALLFLITRYAQERNEELIQPIMDHFDYLASHPNVADSHFQSSCQRLKKSWILMLEENTIKPKKRLSIARLH